MIEMNKKTHITLLLATSLLFACTQEEETVCRNDPPGFLISNVEIIDGSGSPAFAGSVRVNDGLIADIGDLEPCDGETVIDGAGQTLTPGFIDTHTHADSHLLEYLDALPVISQGITTIIAGQDGGSPYPLEEFFEKLQAAPATINVASYVGHNTLRLEVMGEDFKRTATDEEVELMKQLLSSELESGALGLAAGLEYEPGIHSETSEVLALAQVAADAGGRYISHVRSEDRWFEDAIDEIILIGRETGMPVQVSHIKLAMKRLWGSAADLIAKLDAARAEGIDIWTRLPRRTACG
jgi:N-acyl-D-amino-acid deacylase